MFGRCNGQFYNDFNCNLAAEMLATRSPCRRLVHQTADSYPLQAWLSGVRVAERGESRYAYHGRADILLGFCHQSKVCGAIVCRS